MPRKYLRFEQMEVFRPMPVPDALKEQIRSDSEKAKALCRQVQQEHKHQTAPVAVFLFPENMNAGTT